MRKDLIEKIGNRVNMVALDVGARNGFSTDLKDIACITSCFGFEPDVEECTRLNNTTKGSPWKSIQYLPTALDRSTSTLSLNLYKQRGCSSVLNADTEVATRFSRETNYIHEGNVSINAKPLDNVIKESEIDSPAFMKIDVQGMEIDVFAGAKNTLTSSLVAIRTEVSFFPFYKNQPLFAEVDQALRPYGFVPMRWLEFHEFRRTTRKKYPFCTNGPLPCSRGQMIHGDVLYLMQPEVINDFKEEAAKRLIKLGLISACYGHLDHAYASFSKNIVRDYLGEKMVAEILTEVKRISHQMSREAKVFSVGRMVFNRVRKVASIVR